MGARPRVAGERMRNPGLVLCRCAHEEPRPRPREKEQGRGRCAAYPAQVARAYFEADSRSASRVILRAKP